MSTDTTVNASFNTVFNVDPGNRGVGHPSMFQTPNIDVLLNADLMKVKTTDPVNVWQNVVSGCANVTTGTMQPQYSVPFDPKDPPLSDVERRSFMKKFRPVIDRNFSNQQPTLLFCLFFSAYNCTTLQKEIRYAVNKWSGYHVGDQSLTELVRLMEDVFSGNARHIDEYDAPFKVLMTQISKEVGRLNELVVNEAVPIIVNGVEQHMEYMKRVNNPISATSLSRPLDTRITGTVEYRSPVDIMSSSGL